MRKAGQRTDLLKKNSYIFFIILTTDLKSTVIGFPVIISLRVITRNET